MTLAARAHQLCEDVVGRLRIVRDDILESSPVESAKQSIAQLLGHTNDLEELKAQIDALTTELDVLRRRDRALSASMTRLDEEQRLAARIQQDFLPKSMPAVGPMRFAACFRPAHYVSGDLYDIARLDEHHVGVYLADAVGHGMPAALLTMFMRQALVTKQIQPNGYRLLDPNETLTKLNNALREQNLSCSTFATAIYARVDCRNSEVCFARGGHPAPILISRDGSIREVECEGSLLGVFDDETWPLTCVKVQPGERLLLYSDGIEHAFCPQGEVGGDHWKSKLAEISSQPTADLFSTFEEAMNATTNASARDDLTMIVVEHAE